MKKDNIHLPEEKYSDTKNDLIYEDLRRLLIKPEQDKILKLEKRFGQKESLVQEISNILPDAISKSHSEKGDLEQSLSPLLGSSIKSSIKKDLSSFADALYPIMGPAIRKSITQSIKELLQSLNIALENSLSLKGISWRIKAIQTGKPFAEIALLNSLVYRTEQVYLIHRKTGSLLAHQTILDHDESDSDIISGMMKAITDFAKDSFDVDEKSILESFEIEDLNVLIEAGPLAMIALTIRGEPPKNIRDTLHQTLEYIHLKKRAELENFKGYNEDFNDCKSKLQECLKLKHHEKKQKSIFSFKVVIFLIIILLTVLWPIFSKYKEHKTLDKFINIIREEPGIIVTKLEKKSDQYIVTAFRDPLATHPRVIQEEHFKALKNKVVYILNPYLALNASILLKRITKILTPPSTVSLSLKNSTLNISGVSSYSWSLEAKKNSKFLIGITRYDDKQLKISEEIKIYNLSREIQKIIIPFRLGSTTPIFTRKTKIDVLNIIKKITFLANKINLIPSFIITGHTDKKGLYSKNIILGKNRANNISNFLVNNGVLKKHIKTKSAASDSPFGNNEKVNRRVSLKVVLIKK